MNIKYILRTTLKCAFTGLVVSIPYDAYGKSKRYSYGSKLDIYKFGLKDALNLRGNPDIIMWGWVGAIFGLSYGIITRNPQRVNLFDKIGLTNYRGNKRLIICGGIIVALQMLTDDYSKYAEEISWKCSKCRQYIEGEETHYMPYPRLCYDCTFYR